MTKGIPLEALMVLRNHLDTLPARSIKRRFLIEETAELYNISVATLRRALRQQMQLHSVRRTDYNSPRITSQLEMQHYCELIAALKVRTTNKKGRHLSTQACIRLLEEHGVETKQGLIKSPQNLLKCSTVSRYLTRLGLNYHRLQVEPTVVHFQATYSNECWQFDFSHSDLKKLKTSNNNSDSSRLILASVVDDRSGVCYQEYHYIHGEDTMTALRFLFNAMAPKKQKNCLFQGIPKIIYLDNGPVAKSNLFKRVMAYLGIEIRTHLPAGTDGRRTTSRAKGKVERQFRTIKDSLETLYHFHEPNSLEEANEWLRHYLQRYNMMPHRSESHSRIEDWVKNLPPEGFKEMCGWDRFRTFAREPELRKVCSDACVVINGIRYQVVNDLAGQEVTLLWGLFDNELYVEYNDQNYGPFYPAEGPVPLDTYKRFKKSSVEKRADKIGELAHEIALPRTALTGGEQTETHRLISESMMETQPSIPFADPDPFQEITFKNIVEAKLAIAAYLGYPLSRLHSAQMNYVNKILAETLDKKIIMAQVRSYFAIRIVSTTEEQSNVR